MALESNTGLAMQVTPHRVPVTRKAFSPWHRLVFQLITWITGIVTFFSRVVDFPLIGVLSSWTWVPFTIGTACTLIWVHGWTIPGYCAYKCRK
ncbi:hypothetical protein GCM10010401_00110 [Rarobacter faecitabidus]|uniref:Uncharacterized protein n=1 Tax=Rarobacter faecitabidus TaxID=13243 RepID=A0A542ZWX5_RARFA|nr:hypothetical protein FB461_1371 [Rarobacter faecitabidus]